MILKLSVVVLTVCYTLASNLCPINCKCLTTNGQCIVRTTSSVCLLKWGSLSIEINSWNLTDDLTFAMCRSLHFLSITGDIEYVDGSKLKIPSPNLTDFHLENSRIQIIHDYSLRHLPSVKNVFITSNSFLTKLSPNFLYNLRQLYLLDLSYNSLMDISDSFRVPLSELKILKLHFNKITTIKPDTFRQLRQLKVLELSHNHIMSIDDYGFRGLSNVVNLDLDHNSLYEINHLELLELVSLQKLNLHHNRIELFTLPSCNRQLKFISLNYNNMTMPPIISHTRCVGLKKVLLRHNLIEQCYGKKSNPIFDISICEFPLENPRCPTNTTSPYIGLCIVLIVISLCILTLAGFLPILICKHQRRTGCHKFQLKKSIFNTTFSNQLKPSDQII